MKYCSECGQPVDHRIPDGDNRERAVCDACGIVHYQNPNMVLGCIPVWNDQVLLCKRAIEPRRGYWTVPAGFMENDESIAEAAERETQEEALADVEIGELQAVVDVVHARQVHIFFRATMRNDQFGAGIESLDVRLFDEADIPWDDIAFPSTTFALKTYLEDRAAGVQRVHRIEMARMPFRPPKD
ncbi:MAG: NUDIX hydrolase [Pseudomonadota bacterium]